jgi:hypothetical protein
MKSLGGNGIFFFAKFGLKNRAVRVSVPNLKATRDCLKIKAATAQIC